MATAHGHSEFRADIPDDEMAVIDAVVQATPGASRTSLVRELISLWVAQKVHEASLIHRVRRSNGTEPEPYRNSSGKRAR